MLKLLVSAEILKNRAVSSAKSFFNGESGATAIEYGLIAALVSVAIVGVLGTVGDSLKTTFSTVSSKLTTTAQ
ncbi:MAG TPA: Flp family type IVb pilin [Candidatus Sulfotelmatobacter sp.]|jgi:pilus assembly protein Flp/PilA|nr:Flp family type IVb pilin [Candidatus Sulfotelmatobacter sp.]